MTTVCNTTRNIEAAAKAVRLLLENHQCGDLPGRVGENGVKTRVANRDWFEHDRLGKILNRIDIKTSIHGEYWEVDNHMERLEKQCKDLAFMFHCQCFFEDFGYGCKNRLEVRVSHA